MNVHPADLEEAMTKQPGVRGCVVVPCETIGGPEPVAVVLFAGSDDELHATVGHANHGLAEYQQIRRVLRWPDLQFPYTSTGKLLRRSVAEWACATLSGQHHGTSADAVPGGDALLKLIAEITGESPRHADGELRLSEDLHLDSLGRVQLQTMMEQRLGIELDDDAIAGVKTLGDLRTLLKWEGDTVVSSRDAGSDAHFGPVPASSAEVPAAASPLKTVPPSEREAAVSEHAYPQWPWSWPARAIRVAFIELVMRPLIWLLAAPRVVRETTAAAALASTCDCESCNRLRRCTGPVRPPGKAPETDGNRDVG